MMKNFWLCGVCLFALAVAARAQGTDAGTLELAGTGSYAHVNGVNGYNHFSFGPSALYNVNAVLALGGEYDYQLLGSKSGVGSAHLQAFGPLLRVSTPRWSRIAPYGLFGGGAVNLEGSGSIYIPGIGTISTVDTQKGYYLAFGGGTNVFLGARWGVRPEFRYERQNFSATGTSGAFGQNDFMVTGGVFYQFAGK